MTESAKSNEVAPKPGSSAASPDPYKEGAARIRTTATWLLTTFGALGAALVGTLSIASLAGQTIEDSWQAVGGFFTAIVGCVVAILAAAYTLTTVRTNLRTLRSPSLTEKPIRAYAERLDNITNGFGGLDQLISMHLDALSEGDRAYLDNENEAVEEARRILRLTQPRVTTLLTQTAFESLRRRFRVTVLGVCIGVLLAAAGSVFFATGVPSQDDDGEAAVPDRPAYAAMTVSEDAQTRFAELLGSECDLSGVLVVVTASEDASFDITASAAGDDCALASFEASDEEVSLINCRSALETSGAQASLGSVTAISETGEPQPQPADPPAVCRVLDYDGDEVPLSAQVK